MVSIAKLSISGVDRVGVTMKATRQAPIIMRTMLKVNHDHRDSGTHIDSLIATSGKKKDGKGSAVAETVPQDDANAQTIGTRE